MSYGVLPFVLDDSDVATAKTFGLLREESPINTTDRRLPDYGESYNKKQDIITVLYASQQAVQQHCKQFALDCGFQLLEAASSSANAQNIGFQHEPHMLRENPHSTSNTSI
ncbi:hypothetical protein PF010_g5280 [Phytophthora fragariae]|uniref:Uncharacterized protein n=1 Tax=Phytophthora fragariae TaxID=53985 RepID=A0A6G0SF92_9STRA|nr:hypothetical protein PF010_g5280 [Phytophthora fragariae]KAE9357068.1 hypothetical protein PF008_g3332 [Phytophthora fragariae]